MTMARAVEHDVEFNEDVHIERGDKILMNFPAARHDPEYFEDPDTFIIDRARNRHVAFGSGIHRCAGSTARLETTTALRVWMERIPEVLVARRRADEWAGGQARGAAVTRPPSSPPAPSAESHCRLVTQQAGRRLAYLARRSARLARDIAFRASRPASRLASWRRSCCFLPRARPIEILARPFLK